ncbi:transporter substrate-binding domain-containing protein [Paenibacillus arenosi]|nr:transporter substrate-binding domain-containing protein [Paenibacillus arenosi]
MKQRKLLLLLMVCMLVMTVLAGCGSNKDKYDTVLENKKIVMATSADYPPFEFHKDIDGKDQIVGYDIMVAQEIAKDLGVELEIQDMKFDVVLESINKGNADMALAGIDRSPEREKAMLFSDIIYQAEVGVLVRAEDADKYKSIEDLKGKKVGVQSGSTFEEVLKQIPDAQADRLPKVNDLVLSLETNRVDAVLVEKPVAAAYASNNNKVTVSSIALKPIGDGYSVAIPKGSDKLKDAINKTIKRLKDEGKLDQFITEANALSDSQ